MSASKNDSAAIEWQADELLRHWLDLGRWMLSRKVSASLHPELAGKLSPGKLHALAIIFEAGEPRIGELAAALSLDESTVTRLVDKLEAAGLAERRHSSADRRSTIVAITKKGRKTIELVREHRRAFVAEVLASLDPSERAEFVRMTAKAVEVLRLRKVEAAGR
jgi:DNA-binding MarR family transcriptional regulator